MDIRYHNDPDTGLPHIYGHGVTEAEVEQVLRNPGEDLPGNRDSRMKLAQTDAGRYLQVIYTYRTRTRRACSSSPRTSRGAKRNRHSGGDAGGGPMSEPQKFPPGWDESRVRDVLAHYEGQTEDEQAAEIEAALDAEGVTMIAVPTELADEVRALIARKRSA